MPFGLDDYSFAILITLFCGAGMGYVSHWLPSWLKWHTGSFYVNWMFQKRGDKLHMLRMVKKGLGVESFHIGEKEFIIPSPAPILFYMFGRPVLVYLVNKTRPRHTRYIEPEKGEVIDSSIVVEDPPNKGGKRPIDQGATRPDAEARSVGLFYRRGLVKQMLVAAKGIDLRAAIPFVLIAGLAAFFIAYAIFVTVHPGFYPNPPPGYYYKAIPYPTNVTAGATTTVIH